MYLHINHDGIVSPCTLDWPRDVAIGDAKKESATDIWRGKTLKDLQISYLDLWLIHWPVPLAHTGVDGPKNGHAYPLDDQGNTWESKTTPKHKFL